jgi:hypothetical protein
MTQAKIFENYMRAVWNGVNDLTDDENSELYNEHNNACEVAGIMGAKPTSPQVNDAGIADKGTNWLFPDGSTTWIITDKAGTGVGTTNNQP